MSGVNLAEVLLDEMVILDCEPFKDKENMFDVMTAKFEEAGFVSDAKAYKDALEYRELPRDQHIWETSLQYLMENDKESSRNQELDFVDVRSHSFMSLQVNLVKLNTSLYWQYLKIKRMITI